MNFTDPSRSWFHLSCTFPWFRLSALFNLVPQEPPYLQYHIGLCNPCKPSFCSTPQSTWQFIASTRWSLLYDRIIMKIGHIGEQGYLCRGIFSIVNRNWNHQSVSRLIVADPTGVFFLLVTRFAVIISQHHYCLDFSRTIFYLKYCNEPLYFFAGSLARFLPAHSPAWRHAISSTPGNSCVCLCAAINAVDRSYGPPLRSLADETPQLTCYTGVLTQEMIWNLEAARFIWDLAGVAM